MIISGPPIRTPLGAISGLNSKAVDLKHTSQSMKTKWPVMSGTRPFRMAVLGDCSYVLPIRRYHTTNSWKRNVLSLLVRQCEPS